MSNQSIVLNIKRSEAIVLLDFLSRELDTNKENDIKNLIKHDAELQALNSLLCALEPILDEAFAPNYLELVEEARMKLSSASD